MRRAQRYSATGYHRHGRLGDIEIFTSSGHWYWWRCHPGELPWEAARGPYRNAREALRAPVGAVRDRARRAADVPDLREIF